MTLLIFKFSFYQAKEVLNCSYLKTRHKTQNNEMIFLIRTLLNSKTSFLIVFCMSLVSVFVCQLIGTGVFQKSTHLLFLNQCDYCSDPSWGGRNYILNWVFFVQSILADRYIHRRELKLVSLESLSSVKYGIKFIFLIFFLTGRYRGLNFRENSVNSVDFIHLFSEF